MEESWISLGNDKGNDSRLIRYVPISIDKSRKIFYEKLDKDDYQKENYRFLGYERIDLAKRYGLTSDYLKAEDEWLKTKSSNAFIPDKLLALYNYAKEVVKNQSHNLSIRIEADSREGKTLRVFYHYVKDTFIYNDTECSTLKAAFNNLLEYLKNHQTDYAEFNVDAEEDWYVKKFESKLCSKDFSRLDKDEQELIKDASQSIEDFLLNKYYFKYVHRHVYKDHYDEWKSRKSVEEECILAKTQEEAEAIYNKTFPRGGKVNCGLAEYDDPYDAGQKHEIEDLKRKIEQYEQRIKELEEKSAENFVRAEIGFVES